MGTPAQKLPDQAFIPQMLTWAYTARWSLKANCHGPKQNSGRRKTFAPIWVKSAHMQRVFPDFPSLLGMAVAPASDFQWGSPHGTGGLRGSGLIFPEVFQ